MEMQDYLIESRGQSPFIDVQLRQHATRHFPKRALSDIGACSTHQVAAGSNFPGIAYYHVSPDNHICPGNGCPGICYHFAIDYDGTIYQVNDLTDAVYSSGSKKNYRAPSQADCFDRWGKYFNKYSISVLLRGSFDGQGFKGSQEPTLEQLFALDSFARWATQETSFVDGKPIELRNFLGHCHVNKKACPGFIVQDRIENQIWTGKFLEVLPMGAGSILGGHFGALGATSLGPFVGAGALGGKALLGHLKPKLTNDNSEVDPMAMLRKILGKRLGD